MGSQAADARRRQATRAACFQALVTAQALVAALGLFSAVAHAATVEVTIQGVADSRGTVLVALCTRAEFLHPACTWHGQVDASAGSVVVTIPDVPPGIYAAQAFHDGNANGRLDRNILGWPKEAMGFSRDAPMHMGPPSFDAASFSVTESVTRVSLTLHGY